MARAKKVKTDSYLPRRESAATAGVLTDILFKNCYIREIVAFLIKTRALQNSQKKTGGTLHEEFNTFFCSNKYQQLRDFALKEH